MSLRCSPPSGWCLSSVTKTSKTFGPDRQIEIARTWPGQRLTSWSILHSTQLTSCFRVFCPIQRRPTSPNVKDLVGTFQVRCVIVTVAWFSHCFLPPLVYAMLAIIDSESTLVAKELTKRAGISMHERQPLDTTFFILAQVSWELTI
jgi:hypothetical protein